MKLTNRLKKKMLVLDGIDNDFIDYGAKIACPECEGVIVYSVVNSYEFDTLSEEVKCFLVKKMKGVKLVSENKKYSYDESQLDVSKNSCSKCLKEFSTVLTYKEVQPARYRVYLVGLFDGDLKQIKL
ncbi:TPA: hypothetical protein ACJIWU_000510 [Enterobacter chengduensis]|uniref:Uncharacterized protein n=1 Tax=Enterobacter chengduensis TaxID=2494701 RepID=A0AAW3HF15_9ENTR|nr:hypothetical protein [Enterobacter chengduensis]KDF48929.1 hypothetical protein AE07_01849 [Enterobacter cloacae BWH 43]OTW32437.1 hypothetical protein CAP57_24305 [Enterobacter kobei]KJX35309.1 hypothetical protein SG71_14340 [Enterobacter chengduensis]MBN9879446.1 hypothetical protein [Enterobacter chengduensis]MBT1932456.1 hypothetical protein [Enterobacter chengduensis]